MPDPRHGIFETLLVLDGHPVDFDAHLARLEASLATLYPAHYPPSPDVPSLVHPEGHPSDGTSRRSIRVTVTPGPGRKLNAQVTRRQAPRAGVASLCSVSAPGGLGTHKWMDRSLLEEAQAGLPADGLPLIVDSDGTVLEASRANVFVVRGGALLTPPLDGRILPGITRMRVLELAASLGIEVHEESLSREDLLAADEVFLTGSVRGVEPARSLDGEPLRTRGHLTADLSAELGRSWAAARVR